MGKCAHPGRIQHRVGITDSRFYPKAVRIRDVLHDVLGDSAYHRQWAVCNGLLHLADLLNFHWFVGLNLGEEV